MEGPLKMAEPWMHSEEANAELLIERFESIMSELLMETDPAILESPITERTSPRTTQSDTDRELKFVKVDETEPLISAYEEIEIELNRHIPEDETMPLQFTVLRCEFPLTLKSP